LKDSGTHFDKMIVDAFLAVSTDNIIRVFLTENKLILQEGHRKILERYSMINLYNLLTQKEYNDLDDDEKSFIDVFQFYYTAKSNKENEA
ncbi:MAG: hypothetical protein WCG95_08760, partial [bacterium]